MKINKIQENMQKEIAALTEKLGEYREFLKHWQHKVVETEQKLAKLSSASAALEGAPVLQSENIITGPPQSAWQLTTRPPNGTIGMVNGDLIVLEPGFKIGKNSLGEDCIVPVGFEFPKMAEPLKPGPAATSIPDLPEASNSNNDFDKPEDLL